MEESTYLNHNQLSIQGDIYLQHIIDIEINREINKHTELTVIGIIDEIENDTYLDNIKYGAEISLKYGTETRETLFGGIIVDVEIKEYKRSYYVIIKAKSATWIMDQKLKKRSFNKDTIIYEDILKVIENDYERCNFISDDKCSQKVENLIVQYDETDFEFLKRIASQLGLVVIPEDLFNLPRFYFGISTRNSIELNKEDYNLVKYFDNLAGEKYEYKLVSGQVLEVGYEVVLENQRFIVIKCESKLIDSELAHTYTILERNLTEVPKIYNENIRGTAIEGVVIEPKGTRAKVQLNIDNENVTNWYDFIVGSNNALYSMPYAGDNVKVYFPSNEEEEAKISFTTYGGTGLDPDTKFWSNRDGKKIEYTPQTIEISAKNGTLDSSKEHSIKFTDSSGIDIKSDLKITIMSAGDLSLKAKNIEIIGKQGVSLNHYPNPKERNTGIPKGITIDATDVSFKVNDAYFEGSEKRPYPIESDPKPTKPKPQTKQVSPKVKNEARVESGWKTFAKGLGFVVLAVVVVAAVIVTDGAALAVAAPLLEGGVISTTVGVGVVTTAAVGTTMAVEGAAMEANIGTATMGEGLDEVQNGEKGIDEEGYNRIRDGEFGGDEEKYQQYKDQAMGLWQSGIMLNMTAVSVGVDLLPCAAVADTMLYSKVSTTFSNGNFMGVFRGSNNTYGFAAGKGVVGEQGEAAFNNVINNGGKGFLFQTNKGGFGMLGASRPNVLPGSNAIVPRTSNFPVVQNSYRPPMMNFNTNIVNNQALITGNNPLLLNERIDKADTNIGDRSIIYQNLRDETQRKLNEWLDMARDIKNKDLSVNKLKPAFSTGYNINTGNYHYSRNLTKEEVRTSDIIYHPYTKERIDNMSKDIYDSYKDMTNGAGTHAECLVLNGSLLDEFCRENNIKRSEITQEYIDDLFVESPNKFKQDPNNTVINVVNSGKLNNGDLATPGNPMPRCPHCKHITLHADILDEILEKEKEMYEKRFPNLNFNK